MVYSFSWVAIFISAETATERPVVRLVDESITNTACAVRQLGTPAAWSAEQVWRLDRPWSPASPCKVGPDLRGWPGSARRCVTCMLLMPSNTGSPLRVPDILRCY